MLIDSNEFQDPIEAVDIPREHRSQIRSQQRVFYVKRTIQKIKFMTKYEINLFHFIKFYCFFLSSQRITEFKISSSDVFEIFRE